MNDNRNAVVAGVISVIILLGWQYFFGIPAIEATRERNIVKEQILSPSEGVAPGPVVSNGSVSQTLIERSQAIAVTPRVTIDTPNLRGSINLLDGRLDDISFKKYREMPKADSTEITILSPEGTRVASYARFGWIAPSASAGLNVPDSHSMWEVEKPGGVLTPSSPVTLIYDNGKGLVFRRTFSVDDGYMISVVDQVINQSGQLVSLHPYSAINLHGTPENQGNYILHEGVIAVLGEEKGLQTLYYDDLKERLLIEEEAKKGWLGISSKYWASILIPDQNAHYRARIVAFPNADDFVYQTSLLHDVAEIQPQRSYSITTKVFVGAKEVRLVDSYAEKDQIYKFDQLIDWGYFYFITKPLFFVLRFLYEQVGNFGVAILIITVLVKAAFFPLAYKSYVSMCRLKLMQPELLKIRESCADNPSLLQKKVIEFYKEKKINPASGCLPVLIQVPVFFALYKVLFVTIEMRHAPFFGWIEDLAAPDPTSIFNLFGLLPWDPKVIPVFGEVIGSIGGWPILMATSLFLQMRISSTAALDRVQAMIMNWMPLLLVIMLSSFPAGLVIYWTWSNVLSIIQQAIIMRFQGVKIELWDNLKAIFISSSPTSKDP